MRYFPNKTSQYPIFILMYWLIIWGAFLIYQTFVIISSLTPDGKHVEKVECLTVDRVQKCDKYYISVGGEVKYSFIQSGVVIGWAVIIGGSVLGIKSRYAQGRIVKRA